ncbi:MAG: molybdopterin-dependent oxidoreductase [Acidimicrobiia bacterium]|nr:molybdopterin-dependent oxidoreductase [Acidimicrobiia bacterium]
MTVRRRNLPPFLLLGGLIDAPGEVTWEELGSLVVREAADVALGFDGDAVAVAGLIDRAAPTASATHCTVVSDDGHYRASIPIDDLRGKGWLIFRLDGAPLPRDRGGPLRLVVPEGRTLCWNVKAVVELVFTEGPEPDSVPAEPPH